MDKQQIAEYCVNRQSELEAIRKPFEPWWQSVAENFWPAMADIMFPSMTYGSVEKKLDLMNRFESHGMRAIGKGAAAIQSVTTPQNVKWQKLGLKKKNPKNEKQVIQLLDDLVDFLFALRNSPSANFYTNTYQVYQNIMTFGHGPILVHDTGTDVLYISLPVSDVYFDTDSVNRLSVVHRKYQMTAIEAANMFGDKDLPDKIKSCLESKDKRRVNQKFTFYHCVYKNEKRIFGRKDWRGKPWLSVHLCDKKVVHLSGYRTMPYMIPRYETIPNTPYSFSPGIMALPDIKMVNQMGKLIIRGAELRIAPPILAKDDGLLDNLSIAPASVTYGGLDVSGQENIRALNIGGDLSIGVDLQGYYVGNINDAFLVTLFQILVDQPNMTATEVLQRAKEKGILLAPFIGRIQTELLNPMTMRELDILIHHNILPEIPEGINVEDLLLDIEYKSAQVDAMKSAEALSIARMYENLAVTAQFDQNLVLLPDHENAFRKLSEGLGVSPNLLKKTEEYQELVKQKREAEAQAMQVEQIKQLIDSAPAAAQTVETLQGLSQQTSQVPITE